ncbi:MAG TPA: PIG-L family deacetylase [Longimicrobiales bacterium]
MTLHRSVAHRLFPTALAALALTTCLARALPAQNAAPKRAPTILAVFAHPDDERIVGPLLARYAREGAHVLLVVATDGRKGVTPHYHLPAGDSLAHVRASEARCAAAKLGLGAPRLLGLQDAGLGSFEALGILRDSVRAILRQLRPDVVLSFGPEGGTGHPDHRLVGDVVSELVQQGVDGAPRALFYASLPAERMRSAPRAQPTVTPMATRYLTVRVPFEPRDLEATRQAFACHASQYTPEQQAAVMRYLEHGFEGAVRLRPWDGVTKWPFPG